MKPRLFTTDIGFAEGPVFARNGDIALVSIDQGIIRRWSGDGELLHTYDIGGGPNGLTEGPDDVLYVAQCGAVGLSFHAADRNGHTGGVQALKPDGTVEWVTQDPIWPNDLCFGPDGRLYVTDPSRRRPNRDGGGRIWSVDLSTGDAVLLVSPDWYPNGIGFSHADEHLYVASTGDSRIMRLTLDDGKVVAEETFIQMTVGKPDGFCFDADGNIIICALGGEHGDTTPGQIQVWSSEGEFMSVFEPGPSNLYTNAALSHDGRLLIADAGRGEALIVDDWGAAGLPLHPFR